VKKPGEGPHIQISNVRDLVAASSLVVEGARTAIVWLAPASLWVLFAQYGVRDRLEAFLASDGSVRGLTHVTSASVGDVHALAQKGATIRHLPDTPRQFALVADGKESVSALQIDPARLGPDATIAALWSSEPQLAQWLLTQFEAEWARATDSVTRIAELLEGR